MSPNEAPKAIPDDKISKITAGIRKAGYGKVEHVLKKHGIASEHWGEVLPWLMRLQGDKIGHHWQIVTAFALLENATLPLEDATWLLESLGEDLAYGADELVFHGYESLLPGWHSTLDSILFKSFSEHVEELRTLKVHDRYRLVLLYVRAHLGDEISEEEKAEIVAALAATYVTSKCSLELLLPMDDELEELCVEIDGCEMPEEWEQIVEPFVGTDEWQRAVGAAAAKIARIDNEYERPTIYADRIIGMADGCDAQDLAIAITFGIVGDMLCDEARGEAAEEHLKDLEADEKKAILATLRKIARDTEQDVPKEVSCVLSAGAAEIVEEIEALAARSTLARDVRFYVPIIGESSKNGIAEIAPGAYTDDCPSFDDVPMEPLVTIDLDEVPELKERFPGDALVFFLSSLDDNEAHEFDSGQVAVQVANLEHAREFSKGTPFRLVPVDVPAAAFDEDPPAELEALAERIIQLPARVLGPPAFIQDQVDEEGFVMQMTEDFVDANFGSGVMYLYNDDGFWQC